MQILVFISNSNDLQDRLLWMFEPKLLCMYVLVYGLASDLE